MEKTKKKKGKKEKKKQRRGEFCRETVDGGERRQREGAVVSSCFQSPLDFAANYAILVQPS